MDLSPTPPPATASIEALRQALAAERQARHIAEVLRSANLALTRSLDPAVVMAALLEHLGQLVPYDSASVILLDDEGRLQVRAGRGYERFTDPALPLGLAFDPEGSFLSPVIARRRSFLMLDTALAASWRPCPGLDHVRNWFGVPLVAGERLLGLFAVDKTVPGFFTPAHVNLAELLAVPAAIALQNARLFAEVEASRAEMQALSARLVAVQEEERAHLARELHDEIGQLLTGLSLSLTVGPRTGEETLRERVAKAQAQLSRLTAQVRTLSLNLRPAMLDDLGLLAALSWLTRRYSDQTGVAVRLKHTGLERPLPPVAASAAYRVVQEALNNVARHAAVSAATVQVWSTAAMLAVQVVDEGRGFDPQAIDRTATAGLSGMAERVRLAGGTLAVESAPGRGTRILAELPLPAAPADPG